MYQVSEHWNTNPRVNHVYKEKQFVSDRRQFVISICRTRAGLYGEHSGQFSERLNKNTRVDHAYKKRAQTDGQSDVNNRI